MVDSITSFSRSGLRDWLMQRVSAVIIGFYSVFMLIFFLQHAPVNQAAWQALFHHVPMKILTMLTILSVLIHAWIGMWTIYTDYVKCAYVRFSLQLATVLGLLSMVLWCAVILWGGAV